MGSPEAMNLGSPTTSAPVAPSTHYLPGYLLGDYSSLGHSPMLPNRSWLGNQSASPPKALNISQLPSQMTSPPPSRPMTQASPGRLSGSMILPSPSVMGRNEYKPGAPPTAGLFDNIQTSPLPTQQGSLATIEQTSLTSDSFYAPGENSSLAEIDEFWVTVFGFPPAAASFILQQFAQCGNIIKHVLAPYGNWMHLQFQSKIQAKKALSKNGKVFSNNIMVGVSPCSDPSVMSGGCLPSLNDATSTNCSFSSPSLVNASLNASTINKSRSMRPLTSSSILNTSVREDRDIVSKTATPTKSSGLLSKTVDYLFGW